MPQRYLTATTPAITLSGTDAIRAVTLGYVANVVQFGLDVGDVMSRLVRAAFTSTDRITPVPPRVGQAWGYMVLLLKFDSFVRKPDGWRGRKEVVVATPEDR